MPAPRNESSTPVCAFFAASASRWRIELHLGERRRHVELAVEAHSVRDLLEELVDRRDADRGEHLVAVAIGEREVPGRHCSATTAWYASTSSRSFDLGRIGQPDPHEPALAVGIVVDRLRLLDRLLVHLEDLARERRDHVRDRLDGLDLAVRLVLRRSLPPTAGASKWTSSPSASWAHQVIPSTASSPSIRAQSCSGWYLRSSG